VSDPPVMTLVVATRNAGKLTEIRAALEGLGVSLVTVEEVLGEDAPVIVETGATFQANAILKAREVSEATHLVALADDSGLEVDALDGKPGVRSARYARDGANDAENNAALLTALTDVDERKARFRCVMAIWDPFDDQGEATICEGSCEGTIAKRGRGTGGFGYDPLFVVDGTEKTFAELTPAEKLDVSHRGKALRGVRTHIQELVRARLAEADRILRGRSAP
jgi:XTP/dITP diphosphohydrolase